MAGITVVLNGTSSAGKSSLAEALREQWPGHLQISGIDTFLACQSDSMFSPPGLDVATDGFTWQAVVVDGADGWAVVPGSAGSAMCRAVHSFWAAAAREGLDQVVDHVLLDQAMADDLRAQLSPFDVLYVGVRCPADVVEQREVARGDRIVGQGRGIGAKVHSFLPYDVEVDTSVLSPVEAAAVVFAELARRRDVA